MLKVSYSELTEFAQCRRRWELRYREGWLPPEDPEPLVLGQAVHAGLAAKAKGEDIELATIQAITESTLAPAPNRRRWIAAKALPLVEATEIPEGEIIGVEHRFGLKWDMDGVRFQFVGVMDLVLKCDDNILVLDWKTREFPTAIACENSTINWQFTRLLRWTCGLVKKFRQRGWP